MGKHIIIVGKGNGWGLAPDKGEVWGVNDVLLRRRVDLVFELHNIEELKEDNLVRDTFKRINEEHIPVFMQKCHESIPTSMEFPLKDIIYEFGSDYFANSIAYMIAYAIYTNVSKIDIYGVNMSSQSEYIMEKGSVEFWMGMAMGRGIKISVHGPESMLLRVFIKEYIKQDHLYGYRIPQESARERKIEIADLLKEKQTVVKGV